MKLFAIFLSLWVVLHSNANSPLSGTLMHEPWKQWTPRSELAPKGVLSREAHTLNLALTADEASDFGAWRTQTRAIKAGQVYRFRASYAAKHIENVDRSVIARLEWLDANGGQARPPEYARNLDTSIGTIAELTTVAPDNAAALDIQLSLGFSDKGEVVWSNPILEPLDSFPKRLVRVGTIHHRPRGTKLPMESVEQFCKIAEEQKPKLDILCLPEGITVVGNGRTYAEVSEPVPGPTTKRLGRMASYLNSYVVAGIYEREGKLVYNVAVLIGRDGKLIGKYRKTHLPREEWEAGITPGSDYPVFKTDFGTVGLLVCWDVQFPEPWRALGQRGAEMVMLPIWGGNETLAKARALENQLFVVSSSYDMRTCVIDPVGEIVAEANDAKPLVVTEIDLARTYFQPWLGNMKTRTWKERRPDLEWLKISKN